MNSNFDPSFQERRARASEAKKQALAALKAKPPMTETVAAERRDAQLRRDASALVKLETKRRAAEAAQAAKARLVSTPRPEVQAPTEAERKAARDARYAARQKRR